MIDKWDRRFLSLAETIAQWSKDPSTKVGAVITDEKKVVSLGYNGFPAGVIDCESRLQDRELKLRMTVHAEANAILTSKVDLVGTTIYCSKPPCASCCGLIIQAGIERVVYTPSPDLNFNLRWEKEMVAAREMFDEAGVDIEHA